jgi:hypothetical protein
MFKIMNFWINDQALVEVSKKHADNKKLCRGTKKVFR